MTEPIRIANCSGFYGDRLSAAAEMVEDGPIDVLTGDWLAELTMLILARTQAKRPGGGYARSFVTQMEQVMGTCVERGVKVVSNAGGLDPDGCAEAVAEVAEGLGLSPTIAYVTGDNLMGRLDAIFKGRIDLLSAQVGWSLPIQAALFALGHYLTDFNPARLGVFFPALAFGWLRAKRGTIAAPVLFHAASNIFMEVFRAGYGLPL